MTRNLETFWRNTDSADYQRLVFEALRQGHDVTVVPNAGSPVDCNVIVCIRKRPAWYRRLMGWRGQE